MSSAKKVCKHKNSKGCRGPQPTYVSDGLSITAEFLELTSTIHNKKQKMEASKVHQIFKDISDENCRLLGFNPPQTRPDYMILTVLSIPPPSIRTPIVRNGKIIEADGKTDQLSKIVKLNNLVKKLLEDRTSTQLLSECTSLLQYHVALYINQELVGTPTEPSRIQRRIRENVMSKRVNFSARTVVTGDPNISIDEIGVPLSIALQLTLPEEVNDLNRSKLIERVDNGPFQLPGAKYIIRSDGRIIDLQKSENPNDFLIANGYKVERHLQDGDLVILSRQPTLHRCSIMGHRIKILPYSTFRLNPALITPYNLSFDGSEMTMHIPQSLECSAEISELMMASRHIITPESSRPYMGLTGDALLACRIITTKDIFLERDMVMNVMMWFEDFQWKIPIPAILKPSVLWTGKQIFSMLLPYVNFITYANGHSDDVSPDSPELIMPLSDTRVLVEQGELITGVIDKKSVGNNQGSLVHVIHSDHGHDVTRQFLDNSQKVANNLLLHFGFSISIGDLLPTEKMKQNLEHICFTAKEHVKELQCQLTHNYLEAIAGRSKLETYELMVKRRLVIASREAANKFQSSLQECNNLKIMMTSGSKGSFINMEQICACIGQQLIDEKIIPLGFHNRTLPHFTQFDSSATARGFIENSFVSGMKPAEFFFHAMAGIDKLLQTSRKSRESAGIAKWLMENLGDLKVTYGQVVANSKGDVMQFVYGDDGMDPVALEHQYFTMLGLNDKAFKAKYQMNPRSPDFGDKLLEVEIREEILYNPYFWEVIDKEYEQLLHDREDIRKWVKSKWEMRHFPVNLNRIIWNAQKRFKTGDKSDLSPVYIIQQIELLIQNLNSALSYDRMHSPLFFAYLRATLASKVCLEEYKLSKNAFNWILEEIESRYFASTVHSGEMVGAVAAQSIAELSYSTILFPVYAGVSVKEVNLGIPRMKELLSATDKIKTPSITIYLKEEYAYDSELAKQVLLNIRTTYLRDLVSKSEIFYDPISPDRPTAIEEDMEFVQADFELPLLDIPYQNYSPWLLRLEIDRVESIDNRLRLSDIVDKIYNQFGADRLGIVFTDDIASKLVIRIRIITNDEIPEDINDDVLLKNLESEILKVNLGGSGIHGIKKIYMLQQDRNFIDENGNNSFRPEWILDAEGTGLQEILALPEVDALRTYSTNTAEVEHVLGIEAARQRLIRELTSVISFDGTFVNPRHTLLIADAMTNKGYLSTLFHKNTFKTPEKICQSSLFGVSALSGINESVVLGKLSNLGTGSFDLYLNCE